MPETLRGREIVLAGGSGGLGSAAFEMLAAEGARLVVSYRANRERAERLQGNAQIVQADLSVDADRRRLLDAAPNCTALRFSPATRHVSPWEPIRARR